MSRITRVSIVAYTATVTIQKYYRNYRRRWIVIHSKETIESRLHKLKWELSSDKDLNYEERSRRESLYELYLKDLRHRGEYESWRSALKWWVHYKIDQL